MAPLKDYRSLIRLVRTVLKTNRKNTAFPIISSVLLSISNLVENSRERCVNLCWLEIKFVKNLRPTY